MAELGKIEKPATETFKGKRKLYCMPNVYPLKDAPEEYKELFDKYWSEAFQQIERLETIGKVKKIFCENIFTEGEEALNLLSKINERAYQIVKKKIEEGAVFLPVEKEDVFGLFLDWGNCMRIVRTKEAFEKVFDFYTDALNKRVQHILKIVEDNLSEGEAGMLIIRDEDRVKLQFPKDIEVFLVTPPSYDGILKWIRERWKGSNFESA
ncbi:MAG: hypothetical protein AB1610_02150 [Nitrospirota bacterium]